MLGTPTRHGLELNKTRVVDDIAKEVEVDTMSLCPQLLLLPKSLHISSAKSYLYKWNAQKVRKVVIGCVTCSGPNQDRNPRA